VHLPIGEAIPLVPVAGSAILGLLALATFLVFLVCLGLKEGWDHTIGYGAHWIADKIRDISFSAWIFGTVRPFEFVADVIVDASDWVAHWLAVAALNTESGAITLWHWTAELFWWSVHETKALAVDTWHALEHTVVVTVPDAAKWAYREASAVAHRITNVEAAARRAADRELGHVAHLALAEAELGVHKAEAALDWSEAEVGALGRELGGLKARVEAIARQLSPAAIVALIGATIFTEFGLGWLRCSQVGRLGRSICGMPAHLLEDLVGLLADVVFVAAICEILPLLEEVYAELGSPLAAGLSEVALAVCASPDKWPADPAVPRLHLPAVVFDGHLHLAA
jgi:hypothetical protein